MYTALHGKEILHVYVKCGFSYLKEIRYYVKGLGFFKNESLKKSGLCLYFGWKGIIKNTSQQFPVLSITTGEMLRMLIFIHKKKWSNIFTDRWSTRVRTKSCLLMQSQDACYNDNNMFPPIKITLSFSLKVRWQNGSRFNFIIPIDKESIPISKLLGCATSFTIQPCLIQQAASGKYIPHFHKLQSGQWARQGFHMNNVYDMCREHFIFLRILPKRQQPVDYKAHGSQK